MIIRKAVTQSKGFIRKLLPSWKKNKNKTESKYYIMYYQYHYEHQAPRYKWNIVDSGVKHHNPNLISIESCYIYYLHKIANTTVTDIMVAKLNISIVPRHILQHGGFFGLSESFDLWLKE